MPDIEVFPQGWVTIPIDRLVKADWNYKRDSSEEQQLVSALRHNMMRNGQIENIIVRLLPSGFYEIVNGNHRYDVMVSLNMTEVHCYNLGDTTLAQAQRIAIETNETKFPHDPVKLAGVISEICQEFNVEQLVESMPYSQEDINRFLAVNDFNWDQYQQHDTDDYVVDSPLKKSYKLEFSDQNAVDQFTRLLTALAAQNADSEAFRALEFDGDRLIYFINSHM